MGILNVTPDSFFDGNIHYNKNLSNIFKKLNKCDIIDIGAESSRPGANPISVDEEKNRLLQVIKHIKHTDKFISIDTYKPEVATFCLNNGFNMVNDISGGRNIKMLEVVSDFNVPIALMHMKGNPKNMQNDTKYSNIIEDRRYGQSVLLEGSKKALEFSTPLIEDVRKAVGIKGF